MRGVVLGVVIHVAFRSPLVVPVEARLTLVVVPVVGLVAWGYGAWLRFLVLLVIVVRIIHDYIILSVVDFLGTLMGKLNVRQVKKLMD